MPAGNGALSGLVAQHEPIAVNDEGILCEHQLHQTAFTHRNSAA